MAKVNAPPKSQYNAHNVPATSADIRDVVDVQFQTIYAVGHVEEQVRVSNEKLDTVNQNLKDNNDLIGEQIRFQREIFLGREEKSSKASDKLVSDKLDAVIRELRMSNDLAKDQARVQQETALEETSAPVQQTQAAPVSTKEGSGILKSIGNMFSGILSFLGGEFAPLLSKMLPAFKTLGKVFTKVFVVANGIISFIGGVADAFDDDALAKKLEKSKDEITNFDRILNGMSGFVSRFFGNLIDPFLKMFGVDFSVEEFISNGHAYLQKALSDTIKDIQTAGGVGNWMGELWTAFVEGTKAKIEQLFTDIKNGFWNNIDFLGKQISGIKGLGFAGDKLQEYAKSKMTAAPSGPSILESGSKMAASGLESVGRVARTAIIEPAAKGLASTGKLIYEKASGVVDTLKEYGITAKEEVANVLAQIQGESNFDYSKVENLKYSPERLMQVFPKKFKNIEDARAVVAKGEEAIGNRIYGGRMGNAADEGYKYRGRGLIQLTGKSNYEHFGKIIGADLVNNPELANEPRIAKRIAAAYFAEKKKKGVDLKDIAAVGKSVGYATGASETTKRAKYAENIIAQLNTSGDTMISAQKTSAELNTLATATPTPSTQAAPDINIASPTVPMPSTITLRNDEPSFKRVVEKMAMASMGVAANPLSIG